MHCFTEITTESWRTKTRSESNQNQMVAKQELHHVYLKSHGFCMSLGGFRDQAYLYPEVHSQVRKLSLNFILRLADQKGRR